MLNVNRNKYLNEVLEKVIYYILTWTREIPTKEKNINFEEKKNISYENYRN